MYAVLAVTLLAAAPESPTDTLSRGLMAVLELRNRVPASEPLDRGYFSDRVRQAALRALPELRLMTRENMEVIAKSIGVDLAECEGECEVVTGRKLGADTVVSGELVKIGAQYKLTLRLHATREGRLLSVGQAGGRTLEDLDRDLDQAMAELLAPLTGGARRFAEPRPARVELPPKPLWPWVWTRDRVQVTAGWAGAPGMGIGPTAGIRLFGLEARYVQLKTGDPLTGSVSTSSGISSTFEGWMFGLSPFSFGTDRTGPTGFAFTYFEPVLLYRTGDVTDGTVTRGHTALTAMNRFAFLIGLGDGGVTLRLGLDIGIDHLVSGTLYKGDASTHVIGWPFAGLGFGSP